jgi:hypothetical protein
VRLLFPPNIASFNIDILSIFSLTPAQESELNSIESALAPISTVPGFSEYDAAQQSVNMHYISTQTALPSGSEYSEDSIEYALYEIGRVEAGESYAATQTLITGKARETLVEAYKDYASILKQEAGVKETAKASSSKPTGTAASASASAGASGAPASAAAGVSAKGRMLVGVVVVGAMAAVALL